MTGAQPDFRAVAKVGNKLWKDIGAAWIKDKGNVSISLNFVPASSQDRYSFLLVPNNGKE